MPIPFAVLPLSLLSSLNLEGQIDHGWINTSIQAMQARGYKKKRVEKKGQPAVICSFRFARRYITSLLPRVTALVIDVTS